MILNIRNIISLMMIMNMCSVSNDDYEYVQCLCDDYEYVQSLMMIMNMHQSSQYEGLPLNVYGGFETMRVWHSVIVRSENYKPFEGMAQYDFEV